MNIRCKDIAEYMEELAPVRLAEDWDNVGLLVGNPEQEIKRIMLCLDVTSKVVEEAVNNKVDLILSHHPLIFSPMKSITRDYFKGGIIHKLIKNDISVYSAHTNLDVAPEGTNEYVARLLGLSGTRSLTEYKYEKLYKLVVFVPEESADAVRAAICGEGAGWIGNYSDCSFNVKGVGTFKPREGTNPYIGTQGKLERVDECRIETVVPKEKLKNVLNAMFKVHPYEEVAYDIYTLELKGREYGLGKTGTLKTPMKLDDFILLVKNKLAIEHLRLIGDRPDEISKVAVFTGSFDVNLVLLAREKIDVLITGDIKYHTAMDIMEMGLCVIDAGHFATERIIVKNLKTLLVQRFPQTEIICSNMETDPFIYR